MICNWVFFHEKITYQQLICRWYINTKTFPKRLWLIILSTTPSIYFIVTRETHNIIIIPLFGSPNSTSAEEVVTPPPPPTKKLQKYGLFVIWRPVVPSLLLFDIMENKTIHTMIFRLFCHLTFNIGIRRVFRHINPPSLLIFVFQFLFIFLCFTFNLCEKFKKHNSQGQIDKQNEQHQLLARYPFLEKNTKIIFFWINN